jgi:hypothetical protein
MSAFRLALTWRPGLSPLQDWIAGSELAQMPRDLNFATDVLGRRDLRALVGVARPVCIGRCTVWESGHKERDDLDDDGAFARSCREGEDLRVGRLAELGPS